MRVTEQHGDTAPPSLRARLAVARKKSHIILHRRGLKEKSMLAIHRWWGGGRLSRSVHLLNVEHAAGCDSP